MQKIKGYVLFVLLSFFLGCQKEEPGILELQRVFVGDVEINLQGSMTTNLPVDRSITLTFSSPVEEGNSDNLVILKNNDGVVSSTYSFNGSSIILFPDGLLLSNTTYTIVLSNQLRGANGEQFEPREISFSTALQDIQITSVEIGGNTIVDNNRIINIPLTLEIIVNFSEALNTETVQGATKLTGPAVLPALLYSYSNDSKTLTITGSSPLKGLSKYTFTISNALKGLLGESFAGYTKEFYTIADDTPKFPLISDEELLTKVQQQTFRYFWDFGHPVSGLSRERDTSGEIVTSGGSGFGMMAIVTGIERGFISRTEGIQRITTMIDFLSLSDRFHGAWSHWLNGTTGKVVPFSAEDNGGDLVETSYTVMGLLTVRQYLNASVPAEQVLIAKINSLWESVEWNWYTRSENSLTWHWSLNYGWNLNMKIRGWNEALITYVLAASSQTHGITKAVYDGGWKNSSQYINGNSYFDITLPLGPDYGGPLFFEQYTFLGLDPRNLNDGDVNYWEQAKNHTLINRAYCEANPKLFPGYSSNCWGLTASDGNSGYSAHSPTNDLGVIAPTAALSSIPFTPVESMDAIKHFYYTLGDRLWGNYGFYDAFNPTENWYATSNIAIDQGPIIIMIENHRSGLLWDLFMSCPEVQAGLSKLGFTY